MRVEGLLLTKFKLGCLVLQVMAVLWGLSIVGGWFHFLTIVYLGNVMCLQPTLCNPSSWIFPRAILEIVMND